jgi:hypothetical protein
MYTPGVTVYTTLDTFLQQGIVHKDPRVVSVVLRLLGHYANSQLGFESLLQHPLVLEALVAVLSFTQTHKNKQRSTANTSSNMETKTIRDLLAEHSDDEALLKDAAIQGFINMLALPSTSTDSLFPCETLPHQQLKWFVPAVATPLLMLQLFTGFSKPFQTLLNCSLLCSVTRATL